MRVPDDVFAPICAAGSAAEQSGELEQLFKGKTRAPDQQTGRETFKETIKPSMKLTKRTFLNILAYDISTPGYADEMLARMELLGCSRAREYYEMVKIEWEYYHEKEMKSAAHWYKGQCENEWENTKRQAVRELRKEPEAEQREQRRERWRKLSEMLDFH